MKRKAISLILGTLALSLGVFAFVDSKKSQEEGLVTFATYTNGDAATYYNGISDSISGNTLLTALRNLNLSKRKSTVGYSSMGTDPSGYFKYTDYDTNYVQYDSKGQPYGTKISSFYTYASATSWNREHVWPNSHGGGNKGDSGSPYVDADIHMPRPTISSENSSRGNSFFVEGMNHSSNGWDPYTAGYSEQSRGEAARITFYCMTVNSNLCIAPNNTTPSGTDPITGNSYGSGHTMGNLVTLLKWTINYPVTQREKNRNEGAEYLQGNRNAFIDHPEYACRIWGDVNSQTRSLCQNASWDTNGVSISQSTAVIAPAGTLSLTATSTNSSNISWSSSNTSVASVSSNSSSSGAAITITGGSEGTATITASATINSKTYSATCAVTVSSSGGAITGDGKITITSGTTGLTDTDTTVTLTEGGASFGAKAKIYNSDKIWMTANSGYIYNTTSLGKITKVTVNYASGGSATCAQSLSFGTSAISGHQTSATNGTTFTTSTGGDSNYYSPTGDYGYFNLSITNNKNLQATSIEIEYDDDSSGGDPVEATLSSIAVTGMTQSYTVGDIFSFDGICKATYSDGNIETVVPDSVSSPDMSTAGTKTVTVTYEEGGVTKTTTYQITVSEASQPGDNLTETLTVGTNGNTTWTNAEKTSSASTGLVTYTALGNGSNDSKYYSSDNSWRFYPASTSGVRISVPSGYEIVSVTLTWKTGQPNTPSGTTASGSTSPTTYTVNSSGVTSLDFTRNSSSNFLLQVATVVYRSTSGSSTPTLTSITLDTTNVTTSFEVGDTFNYTGLVVTAHYNDSSSEVISTGYTVSTPDMSTSGQKTITVTYSGVQATYTITVTGTSPQPSGNYSLTSGSPYMNGVPYKMYFTKSSNNYYFTGEVAASYYGATDTVKSNGVDVYFEATTGGQNIYMYKNSTIKYLYFVTSGTHINIKFDATSAPATAWVYDSANQTMKWNNYVTGGDSSHTTFTGDNVVYYAKFETKDNEGAIPFATIMNDYISCNNAGTSAPTFNGFTWANFASVYANLDSSSKTTLQSNNPSNAEVAEYVARYDYIVGKYGTSTYSDFLERNPSPIGNHRISIFNSEILKENSLTLILIITSALTVSAVLGYFLLRKKKQK